MKVCLISNYYGKSRVIHQSYCAVIDSALKKLGIEFKNYIIPDLVDNFAPTIKDSLVIFMSPPVEALKAINAYGSIFRKNNNILVVWCLEALIDSENQGHEKEKKSNLRTQTLKNMIDEKIIDFVFVHDELSLLAVKREKCLYVPIGFDDCLVAKKNIIKNRKYNVCFFGYLTKYRNNFFKKVTSLDEDIKFFNFGPENFKNFSARVNEISDFSISIDYPSTKYFNNFIGIHRLASLSASGAVIFSFTRLERIGFENGKDYIWFGNEGDFCYQLRRIDQNKMNMISGNMLKKIQQKYNMSDIFGKSFAKMGILI